MLKMCKKRVHKIACNKNERKREMSRGDSSMISGGRLKMSNTVICSNFYAHIRLNVGHSGTGITNMTMRESYFCINVRHLLLSLCVLFFLPKNKFPKTSWQIMIVFDFWMGMY